MVEKQKPPVGSSFWQIIFPTLVGGVLLLSLGVWFSITASTGNVSRFAEISTVLLVIPVYVVALLFALLLVGFIYLTLKIIQGIPPLTGWVLDALEEIRKVAEKGSRSLAGFVIRPVATLAIFKKREGRQDSEIKLND